MASGERTVHIAFRPSELDLLTLMKRCPGLRAIQVPPSYYRTISRAVQSFLEMQGVDLLQGDVWGHRKDIDGYFIVGGETIAEIESIVAVGATIDEASEEIAKKTDLAADLIRQITRSKIAL
ncbi:DUF1699 family protein [Candidatus Methanocrinis natronophilus]|uniref:DUF1699 family protein n=1 Tax=Candidatus Methanocrinis natronophilus TaxID=3033396 RepID=A0ABT5X9Q6_9EURY|nr:DUF1699 family protein [Candidatus Methanocrinis natronophilus]MDF0591398.1 DUF1699 family protein [Candidatus Methanocrinis natronophilus]